MTLEERIEDLSKRIAVAKDNPCHVKSGPQGGQFCETKGGGMSVGESHARFEDAVQALKTKKFTQQVTRGKDIVFTPKRKYPGSTTEVVVSPSGAWQYRTGFNEPAVTRVSGNSLAELKDFLASRRGE